MLLELKKVKLCHLKVKNVYLELLLYQAKRNREYEAIMESVMAQAGKTLATKSKITKAAKKVKAIEPKKELVETSTKNKNIGIGIGVGLLVLLIFSGLVS